MRLKMIRGCTCDSLEINGTPEIDIESEETKRKALERIRAFLSNQPILDYFTELIDKIDSWGLNLPEEFHRDQDYELYMGDLSIYRLPEQKCKELMENLVWPMIGPGQLNYVLQWFIPKFSVPEYLFTCDCCGDSIYEWRINI